jgi:curved DNA-binding protein
MKDPYKILGVEKSATEKDIKKAYRKLAKENHPDKVSGNEERFKEIADAYETLGNVNKRSQFDQRSNNPFNGGPFNESFFDDFIRDGVNNPFGQPNFHQGGHGFSTRGTNIDTKIYISLEDAYYGCVKAIRLGTKTVNVNVKPGVKPGQKMRLKVLIQDHPDFYLDNKGLHAIEHIDIYDALLGGKGKIVVFDKTITYSIPKCVRNGTMLRIQGKGFPSYNRPDIHGDFFINILVDLPTKLSEEQEELVEQIRDLDNG